MADDTKTTTVNSITSDNVTKQAPADDAKNAGTVTVKAIRTFRGEEGEKSPESEPFQVTRRRAAELRANGLIEYPNDSDLDQEIEDHADAARAKAKQDAEARRPKKG